MFGNSTAGCCLQVTRNAAGSTWLTTHSFWDSYFVVSPEFSKFRLKSSKKSTHGFRDTWMVVPPNSLPSFLFSKSLILNPCEIVTDNISRKIPIKTNRLMFVINLLAWTFKRNDKSWINLSKDIKQRSNLNPLTWQSHFSATSSL